MDDNSFDIYNPNEAPQSNKKLFGANIDVLKTLESIDFEAYSGDGAMLQTIAYIQFYNSEQYSTSTVEPDFFDNVSINSEQQKCFALTDPKECTYSFGTPTNSPQQSSISLTPFSPDRTRNFDPIQNTQQSSTRFPIRDAFNSGKITLNEISNRVQTGLDEVSKYRNTIKKEIDFAKSVLEIIPFANSLGARNVISTVEDFSENIDKYSRVISTVKDKTNETFETLDNIRQKFDPDIKISLDKEVIRPEFQVQPQTDFDFGNPVKSEFSAFTKSESVIPPSNFTDSKTFTIQKVYNASVSSGRIENLSTYSCKEKTTAAQGIWQFLFNPSELNYSYSSDYAEADVWATPDGKPMHWKGNKNVELKFTQILLNAYMFGRKVESLAQGLKDLMLFNAKSSLYAGSPPVLEFIWGNKKFGPCLMKDLSIIEKLWDGGELVAAECSFTLVSVPEWTVNDGQVDIFDPSRSPVFIPTVETPLLNDEEISTEPEDEVVADAPNKNSPTPNTTTPTPTPPASPLCKKWRDLDTSFLVVNRSTAQVIRDVNSSLGTPFNRFLKDRNYMDWLNATEKIINALSFEIIDTQKSSSFLDVFDKYNVSCSRSKIRGATNLPVSFRSYLPDLRPDPNSLQQITRAFELVIRCRVELIRYIENYLKTLCASRQTPPNPKDTPDIVPKYFCDDIKKFTKYIRTPIRIKPWSGFFTNTFILGRALPKVNRNSRSISHPNAKYKETLVGKDANYAPLDLGQYYDNFNPFNLDRLNAFNKGEMQAHFNKSNSADARGFKLQWDRIIDTKVSQPYLSSLNITTCIQLVQYLGNIKENEEAWDEFRNANPQITLGDLANSVAIASVKCIAPMQALFLKMQKKFNCK